MSSTRKNTKRSSNPLKRELRGQDEEARQRVFTNGELAIMYFDAATTNNIDPHYEKYKQVRTRIANSSVDLHALFLKQDGSLKGVPELIGHGQELLESILSLGLEKTKKIIKDENERATRREALRAPRRLSDYLPTQVPYTE